MAEAGGLILTAAWKYEDGLCCNVGFCHENKYKYKCEVHFRMNIADVLPQMV